ncbi:AP2 domain protein [Cryptosporidium felis]|nr:AP2 domain protein [Cryptosporidium felis]
MTEKQSCTEVLCPNPGVTSGGFLALEDPQRSFSPEIVCGFEDFYVHGPFQSPNAKSIKSFEQVCTLISSGSGPACSCVLHSTTTASSSDQMADQSNPAFPIKEFEEHRRSRTDSAPEEGVSKSSKDADKLDIGKLNSVIREDKEKRKVIVEWLNNNEICCKQWSCKKFGKEGAARRAIQFLEKIHGISIKCIPEGFYSTLLEIGSLEGRKSACTKKKAQLSGEKRPYRRRPKILLEDSPTAPSVDHENGSSCQGKSLSQKGHFEAQCFDLVQKIMLLFSSLDASFFEEKIAKRKPGDSHCPNREFSLHSNCRKQLRKVVLEATSNKKFALNEYRFLLNEIALAPQDGFGHSLEGLNCLEVLENSLDTNPGSSSKPCFDSLFGIKSVKDILNKTVRNDLQTLYALKDIAQIINATEGAAFLPLSDPELVDTSIWDDLIRNESRINDDLHYLSEGGLPGYSSVSSSAYGDGFFHFSSKNPFGKQGIFALNPFINHKKSCMNIFHEEIQDNGPKAASSLTERRRIATRLQGRSQNLGNGGELGRLSCSKSPEDAKQASQGEHHFNDENVNTNNLSKKTQMESAVFTLLDIKYNIKGGQSKQALLDTISIKNLEGSVSGVQEDGSALHALQNANSSRKRKTYQERQESTNRDYAGTEGLPESNRQGHPDDLHHKIQKFLENGKELESSKIEWWKKPRGWKVSYFKDNQRHSQIFKVSLNSSFAERETQYKLAYSFFLSTLEGRQIGAGLPAKMREEAGPGDEAVNGNGPGHPVDNFPKNPWTGQKNASFDLNGCPAVGFPGLSCNFGAGVGPQVANSGLAQGGSIPPQAAVPLFGSFVPFSCFLPLYGGFPPHPPLFGFGLNCPIQKDENQSLPGLEPPSSAFPQTLTSPFQTYLPFLPPVQQIPVPLFHQIPLSSKSNECGSNISGERGGVCGARAQS